jgi:hypothetical protein
VLQHVLEQHDVFPTLEYDVEIPSRDTIPPPLIVDVPALTDYIDHEVAAASNDYSRLTGLR